MDWASATSSIDLGSGSSNGDLEFDGRISDSGGLRKTAGGDELLFVTESNLVPGAATTFVGISATGGTALTDDRFQIDDYLSLESQAIAGSPLACTIQGDLNGDGLVDVGQEYDVSLARRTLPTLSGCKCQRCDKNVLWQWTD